MVHTQLAQTERFSVQSQTDLHASISTEVNGLGMGVTLFRTTLLNSRISHMKIY